MCNCKYLSWLLYKKNYISLPHSVCLAYVLHSWSDVKYFIRNKTSSTLWRTEKKKSSPTYTFYTLGNDTCSLAKISKPEWQKADAKTVEVEKNIHFKIWYACCPKTSAVVKGTGLNLSEKKLKQSSETIKQVRNSSSLMKKLFQLPQEIHVQHQVSFLVNKYYFTERTKQKKHFTEMSHYGS